MSNLTALYMKQSSIEKNSYNANKILKYKSKVSIVKYETRMYVKSTKKKLHV